MSTPRTCKASITVEATFVMPIVILTVFALIYLSFYLHDTCRIQGLVDKTLHKAAISLKQEADLETGAIDYERIGERGVFTQLLGDRSDAEKELRKYLQQELSKGLFLSKITGIQATVYKTKLEISVEADNVIRIPWVKKFFTSFTHTKITAEYPIHDPAETIRICEVILDTASQVKGVDELKDKIEGFFKAD
jgi:HD superfamily phosphohydrolase